MLSAYYDGGIGGLKSNRLFNEVVYQLVPILPGCLGLADKLVRLYKDTPIIIKNKAIRWLINNPEPLDLYELNKMKWFSTLHPDILKELSEVQKEHYKALIEKGRRWDLFVESTDSLQSVISIDEFRNMCLDSKWSGCGNKVNDSLRSAHARLDPSDL